MSSASSRSTTQATQDWKRAQIANLGWTFPTNLVFAHSDFETQDLPSALDAAGFDRTRRTVVSLLGVVDYLTLDATRTTLRQLAGLAAQSEVTIGYNPPPDWTDPVTAKAFGKATLKVDATGESYLGFHRAANIERLAREAGFTDVIHHPLSALNDRPDGLQLYSIQQLLTAVV
jgi:O-methyltransferase involved in polyketide biosynthesis